MTYEERKDAILKELSKVKDSHVPFKEVSENTNIGHNELNRLLFELADKKLITYMQQTEAIIAEAGRAFLDDGGFVGQKAKENALYKHAADSVLWAKIAAILGLISILISSKRLPA